MSAVPYFRRAFPEYVEIVFF